MAERRRPCETKWHFVKTEDGKIFIYDGKNRHIKEKNKACGEVVQITTSKSDTANARLKVIIYKSI